YISLLFGCALSYKAEFFFSSRRRHTRFSRDWSSDVCSSDLRSFSGVTVSPQQQARINALAELSGVTPEEYMNRITTGYDWEGKRSEERRVGKEGRSRGGTDH